MVEDGEAGREAVCLVDWLVVELSAWLVVRLSAWSIGGRAVSLAGRERAVSLAGREADGWWSRMVRLVVRLSAWSIGWWSSCQFGW